MSRDVSSGSDCLDVRDLIERFEELEDERDAMKEAVEEAREALSVYGTVAAEDTEEEEAVDALDEKLNEAIAARDEWSEDNGDEFKKIGDLLKELEGSGGDHQWKGSWYPITLIRDSYFVEAMQELIQDIGDLPKDIPAYLEIDWEKTADNLRIDYSSVEYDGVTYWYR